jgi:LysM repeat protein
VLVLPNCDETGAGMVEVEEDAIPPEVPSIITPAGGPASSGSDSTTGSLVYVVKAGDTLFTIAQRYGITVADIVAANELLDPDRLSLGQELFIPQDGNG